MSKLDLAHRYGTKSSTGGVLKVDVLHPPLFKMSTEGLSKLKISTIESQIVDFIFGPANVLIDTVTLTPYKFKKNRVLRV